MQDCEYHTKDFIVSSKKVFNSNKENGKYSILLISDNDKGELISALKAYFTQLRKKRMSYLRGKKRTNSKVKHNEPKIIILNENITEKDAKMIDKKSTELKNKKIPIIEVFKKYEIIDKQSEDNSSDSLEDSSSNNSEDEE